MVITEEKREEFNEIVKPVMKYLADFHPHIKIIIEVDRAEMVEGVCANVTDEFAKD